MMEIAEKSKQLDDWNVSTRPLINGSQKIVDYAEKD